MTEYHIVLYGNYATYAMIYANENMACVGSCRLMCLMVIFEVGFVGICRKG